MVRKAKLLSSVMILAFLSCGPSLAESPDSAATKLRLSSSDGSPLEITLNAGSGQGFQLRCHGQVIVETEGHIAKADKFTFFSGKHLLVLESHKGNAELTSLGDKRCRTVGSKISLDLSTGGVEVSNVRSIHYARTPAECK